MRSKLFVPGSRPELFAKAMASAADAVSIDLEDAVAQDSKARARAATREFLLSAAARTADKQVIVRVNALGSAHFEPDVQAVALPGLALLNLPKAESADDVLATVALLERIEIAQGMTLPIGILANIETPKGLRSAADIAAAHPRVAGLQLGYLDLFAALGWDRRDTGNVHATLFAVRVAAGAAGVFAYDGAFADLRDVEGLRAEAGMARRLGYWGKSCIHPSQVQVVNDMFQPAATDVAYALRVIEASREAAARGVAAFMLDGKMIDAPVIKRAEAIVTMSRR